MKRALTGATGTAAVLAAGVLLMPTQIVLATGEESSGPARSAAAAPDPNDSAALERGRQDGGRRSDGAGVPTEDSNRADGHVRNDPFLKRVLAGRPYTVLREGPWESFKGGRGIGVLREIVFSQPQNFEMQPWPGIEYDEQAETYSQRRYNVEVRGATSIVLFIDDRLGVVGAQPDSGAEEVAGPGSQRSNERSVH